MASYLTIDGGTTNTRITLVRDRRIIDTLKCEIGAAIGCEQKEMLRRVLKEKIKEILSKNGLCESDISRVLASGMITSEGGLCTLEHIWTPCGISELAQSMHECVINEVTAIPFAFARGVKTDTDELDSLDIMRGEETELMGLTERPEEDCVYLLPGTHSKIIYTDALGRISHFTTALSGDLISAVSKSTILKNSVSLESPAKDREYLSLGYASAKKNGPGTALFKVRILDKILGASSEQCFSFFLGAILQGEVDSIISSDAKKVVIGGKQELRAPLAHLLRENSEKEVVEVSDEVAMNAATYGILRLYEEYLKGKN